MIFHNDSPNLHVPAFLDFLPNPLSTRSHSKCAKHTFKMLLRSVYCCHQLSVHRVRSFQNKLLLEIFPFLSNNRRKMNNTRAGTEIVNPCITCFVNRDLGQMHFSRNFHSFQPFCGVVSWWFFFRNNNVRTACCSGYHYWTSLPEQIYQQVHSFDSA